MQPIKIDSVEQVKDNYGGLKVTFTEGKNKFGFFSKKKDGTYTKAYEQFKKYNFSIGDTVNAEVKEEQKTFPDKKTGSPVPYTQRTILYFQEVENTPVFTQGKKTVEQEISEIKERLAKLEAHKNSDDIELPF